MHSTVAVPQAAVPRVGDAREDWAIIRALSEVLGKTLPYSSIDEVRGRLAEVSPHFSQVDTVQPPIWLNGEYFKVGRCQPISLNVGR
jgi:NADH dehydrogenase/NADH:ubiquinone oxidoreductase subunit G